MLGHSCRALHNSSAMKQQPRDTGRGFSRGWLCSLTKKKYFPSVLIKNPLPLSAREVPEPLRAPETQSPWLCHPTPRSAPLTQRFPCVQHVEQPCRASTSEISPDFPQVCHSLCFIHHGSINPTPTARKCPSYSRLRAGSELR